MQIVYAHGFSKILHWSADADFGPAVPRDAEDASKVCTIQLKSITTTAYQLSAICLESFVFMAHKMRMIRVEYHQRLVVRVRRKQYTHSL
jgi:hypothetical protein